MKIPFSISLIAKIALIVVFFIILFIVYNNFVLDKSLAALDASLQTMGTGEASGIGLLLNVDSISEVVKGNFDESRLATLDYLDTSIQEGGGSVDTQIILSNLINEKAGDRPEFLRALDNYALVIKRGIRNIFGLKDEKEQELKESLVEAVEAHHEGDVNKAASLYADIIRSAGVSQYGDIAKALLENLNKQALLREQRDKLAAELKQLSDSDEISNAYLEIGLVETQLLDFDQAKYYFNKVLETTPSSPLVTKAKFYLGWISKQTGQLEESMKYFQELLNESTDEKMVLSSKLQIADAFKRKGDVVKAAQLYRSAAHEHGDSKVASESLTLSKFAYLFNLKDPKKANEVSAELMTQYPNSSLSASAGKINTGRVSLEGLPMPEKGFKEKALQQIRATVPAVDKALIWGEDVSSKFALNIIKDGIDKAIKKNISKGSRLTIDVDPNFIVESLEQTLKSAASSKGFGFTGFTLKFPKPNYLEADGFLKIGPTNFKFYTLIKLSFVDNSKIYFADKLEYNPKNWTIATILEAKLGLIPIPVNSANNVLIKAHKIFNQKQIFVIDDFSLTQSRMYFTGILRLTQEELLIELNSLNEYSNS
ncbi:MAG: hypothetical protein V2A72_04360 [Candidatus Omnitrophota bacterium]